VLELNLDALEHFGDIETAESADAALSLLSEHEYDLIVSDLRMPGALDGIGLYRWLSAEHPELVDRIVFTTADTLSPQAQDFLVHSGRPFIKKPYNIREYQAFIGKMLGRDDALDGLGLERRSTSAGGRPTCSSGSGAGWLLAPVA
jgi:CheY-like chemotaxis protein